MWWYTLPYEDEFMTISTIILKTGGVKPTPSRNRNSKHITFIPYTEADACPEHAPAFLYLEYYFEGVLK